MEIRQNIFLVSFLLLFINLNTALGQFGIKGGLVISGYQPSQDLTPFMGNDYQPFLGYEVDWIHDDAGSPDIGFQVGLFYSKNISKYFALQPELYYSQRGIHFYKTELYNCSYSLNVSYLEIPLLLKYQIPVQWALKPSIFAGPYGAVKLSARRTLEIWEAQDTKSISGIGDLDYGLVVAINSELAVGSRQFIVEFRFNWGLANSMVQPEEYTDLYENAGTVNILAFTFLTGIAL